MASEVYPSSGSVFQHLSAGKPLHLPLWRYQDLLFTLIRLEYLNRIRKTFLGPFWYCVQLIAPSAAFTGIFSQLIRVPTGEVPAFLFFVSGVLAWGFFSQSFSSVSFCFETHAQVFRKVAIPKLTVPLALLGARAIPTCLQLLTLIVLALGMSAGDDFSFTLFAPKFLCSLMALAQLGLLALGCGLIAASLNLYFRDLHHGFGILLQLWFYLTPVLYPSTIASPDRRWIFFLNPVSAPIEVFRAGLFGQEILWAVWGSSWCLTLSTLLVGQLFFERSISKLLDEI